MSSGWERLRELLRPPRGLRITRPGRAFLVITLGVGLGALNTGNNLLYLVLGVMLGTIVASGVLSELSLRGLELKRLGTEAAFAGERFVFRYSLSKQGGASFALALAEQEAQLQGEATLPFLAPGREAVVRANLVASRRGPLRLKGVKVTTTFPLGLFAKSLVLQAEDLLLVFPRRGYTCADPPEQASGPIGDGGNPRRRDGTGDLLGLRELAPGEDARRIHWRKSASAGALLRTEREREERRQYTIELEARGAPEALDRRCEEAAEQARRLLRSGHEVGLLVGRRKLRPAAGPGQERRILTALAWLGFDSSRGPRP